MANSTPMTSSKQNIKTKYVFRNKCETLYILSNQTLLFLRFISYKQHTKTLRLAKFILPNIMLFFTDV